MENLSEILGLLTVKDVAERLDVSIAKVHRLITKGALTPAAKADGQTGSLYFRPEDIDAYLEERAS